MPLPRLTLPEDCARVEPLGKRPEKPKVKVLIVYVNQAQLATLNGRASGNDQERAPSPGSPAGYLEVGVQNQADEETHPPSQNSRAIDQAASRRRASGTRRCAEEHLLVS